MLKNLNKRRPLRRAFFFAVVIGLTSGCSQLQSLIRRKNQIIENDKIPSITNTDFVDHLLALDKFLRNNREIKFKRVRKSSARYLEKVFGRLISNNELLLNKGHHPEFNFIIDSRPYIFSLPNYKFFLSTGLVKKYLKNESLLLSALAFEVIKSGRLIYERKRVFPTGTVSVKEILNLTRIDYQSRFEIYKWTYFALRRAEYDPTAILNWIQTQNKNSLEFSWQIRDPRGVSREEFAFKSFLVGQGIDQFDLSESNSSASFYKFRDSI